MKYLFITALLLSLLSCSTSTKKNDEPGVIQDTTQRLNDYQDTLESSVQNARKVKEQYNQNGKELENNLNNIKIN